MTLYFFDDESQNNYELGSHFLSGEELEQSDEKAFHYLKLAADAGHDQAQNGNRLNVRPRHRDKEG